MAQKVAYVTGGMGGIGTVDLPAPAQGRPQGHRRLRPEPRPREVARRAEGAGLHLPRLGRQRRRLGVDGRRVQKVEAEHGPIDVLVNNAGITRDGMFRKMTRADWDAVIDTNLNSLFNVTKQVIDDMVEQGWGRIINICSVNGEKGQFGPDQLLGGQGRHARLHDGAGAGGRAQGRDGQHRQPGLHRHRHGQARSGRTCSTRSSPPSRSSGWARRRTSPRSCSGWPARIRASRPAPTSRATAACTWADAGRADCPRPFFVSNAIRHGRAEPPRTARADRARRELSHPPQRRMGDRDHRGPVRRQNVIVFSLPGAFTPTCSSTHCRATTSWRRR